MYKNIGLVVLSILVIILFFGDTEQEECIKPEPYQQNQMVDGCVMQKSGGKWIKTCG